VAPARRWHWLFPALAIVAAAAFAVPGTGCRRGPAESRANQFSFASVPLQSPQLAVELTEVRGEPGEGSLEWRLMFICREPEGCHADVVVVVDYRGDRGAEQVQFADTVSAPDGAAVRVGGVKPAREVSSVERVEVRVERTFRPGDPSPTPEL
jgi:hypothetical protein